jgi:hypothetical protein
MLSLPFIVFWLLLFLNRKELGFKWIGILIAIWIGLLAGFMYLEISPYIFIIAESLIDIILILVLLGGDIRIK